MTYLFQTRIPYYTNVPEDVITNTFHMDFGPLVAPGTSDFAAAWSRIRGFYNGCFTSTTVAGCSPWLNQAAASVKVYNLDDPLPRVPVYQNTTATTMTAASASYMPPEAALVVSYQADPVSGVPQARRRGRIYLGGLGLVATAGSSSSFPVPTSTFLTSVTNSTTTFLNGLATDSWLWVVYSRVLNSAALVTNGWVDNAFDTQRRRGQVASARSLWT